jgi:hypothetical protein
MKLENNYKSKTLENLEKEVWGDADSNDTRLVQRVTALRKVPLHEFSVGDIRTVIGQQFSLDYLVPLALDILKENLFVEGDFYEGELLHSVLCIKPEYWRANRPYWLELDKLINARLEEINEMDIGVDLFYSVKDQ